MVRPTGFGLAACAALGLLVARGSPHTAPLRQKEQRPLKCEVTAWDAGRKRAHSFVDDGYDTLELKGHSCAFPAGPPRGSLSGALALSMYAGLVLMPGLFALSVYAGTSNYTWVFLDHFMGLFLGMLWWSCFEESFNELDFLPRVGIFVTTRVFVVPLMLYLIVERDHLYGIASIAKHVVVFMAVSIGTESLKYCSVDGPPDVKLLGVCLLVVIINLALWNFKVRLVKMLFSGTITKRVHDRWEEVTTELGLDAAALCLAAMLFLSANMIFFKKTELLHKEADLSMGNNSLFDQADEGVFAALYSLVMFACSMVMEYVGGLESFQMLHGEAEVGEVAMLLRRGKVNQESVSLWERVVYVEDRGGGKALVHMVRQSVLQDPEDGQADSSKRFVVFASELNPASEETWDDYIWHLMQLTVMASASWSGVLALCCLVRLHLWPSLLHSHLEGSLAVSIISLLMSGMVIFSLAVQKDQTFLPGNIARYLRVYLLRAVSLMAALSWDVTFEHAVEALPLGAAQRALGLEGHCLSCKVFVALLVTGIVAPILVVGMRPNIEAAVALLEQCEKEHMHEHDD